MSLDLTQVAAQVGDMVVSLKAGANDRLAHVRSALDTLHSQAVNFEQLRKKIAASKTTWLVAGLVDGLDRHYQAAPLPEEFNVIATDGSHIDVDRHQAARCYLINSGRVWLHYGSKPDARLDSLPALYAGSNDMVIMPEGRGREQPIEGNLLGLKRGVEECHQLAELAAELPSGSSTLALMDGTLILWGLEGYPDFVTQALLKRGFLAHLDSLRKLNQDRHLAVASYISAPRATDVVNALRVALCPNEPADCDRFCAANERGCDAVSGVQDRDIFTSLLRPGERSALFSSQSSIVDKYYGENRVYFFYLRLDDEVARIEMPEWVATNKELLNLTHSLALDQCRRGQGYPVALAEAHEQAVVTGADRENFWQLVESLLIEEHMPTAGSAKSQSKRTRWI